MKAKEELLNIIELITDKKNPRYKKEIKNIDKELTKDIPWEKLKPVRKNLRGIEGVDAKFSTCDTKNHISDNENDLKALEKATMSTIKTISKINDNLIACGGYDEKVTLLDISDPNSIKTLGSSSFEASVNTISNIGNNLIACGGDDKKVTLLDISDNKELSFISSFLELEESIFQHVTNKSIDIINPNGWSVNEDKTLYKYAAFYDNKLKKVIPYFNVSEKRVKTSEDKTVVTLKK